MTSCAIGPDQGAAAVAEEIRALIFRLGPSLIGLDMAHVAEMLSVAAARKRRLPMLALNERLPGPGGPFPCRSPVALIVPGSRKSGHRPRALVVEGPEQIDLSVPIAAIRLLPRVIASPGAGCPFWAAALIENAIVLLLDIYRLPPGQTPPEGDAPEGAD